jgi:predicted transcriptional regulator
MRRTKESTKALAHGRLTIQLDPTLVAGLDALSSEYDQSMSALVRLAVIQFLRNPRFGVSELHSGTMQTAQLREAVS